MTSTAVYTLDRGDTVLAFRRVGTGPPLVLLHATLSSSRQLRQLASSLASAFDVISVDRRGSGASVPLREEAADAAAGPIDVAVHVADLAALFEAERIDPAIIVGHSYGGCIALELAARRPEYVSAVWAYEPPYAPLGPVAAQDAMADVARRTAQAAAAGGPAAAAEVFMVGVSGRDALDSLSVSARERLRRAGRSAIADAALLGMEPDGLRHISCPVVIAYGADSAEVYAQIATGLRATIPAATAKRLDAADHMAPIMRPRTIAAEIEALAVR